ncbi:MAG: bifunctional folylpolyglutamate synthase/dihydrofolate synthase [Clostridiales bacterium]|nr:bifunctional folylpolyglutamate synthase/dihydrofolate synthase [Clostridiales bacterium]
MNYNQALEYIYRAYKFGSKLGLENITDLLNRLGNPQYKFKYIHVAGTNGKGSVTSMIAHILHEAGYKVGMFTSPYLENFTERIQINLKEMPREDLGAVTEIVKEKVEEMVAEGRNHPTVFEIITAIGLVYFAKQQVDMAVVEVGLGGRFDATNVVDKPLLSVITSIGFDHMDVLGNTLGEIAFEKAGIIKPGRPVVTYPQLSEAISVLRQVSKDRNALLYEVSPDQINVKESSLEGNFFDFRYKGREYKDLRLNLIGEHQLLNAATALTAIEVVRGLGVLVPETSIYQGLARTKWPGRLEKVYQNPLIIIDGAHNAAGASALADTISKYFDKEEVTLVLGILNDKEVDAVVSKVCPLAHTTVTTKPDNPRAMDPEQLSSKALEYCDRVITEPKIPDAIDKAIDIAGHQGVVLICGSLYLAGTARTHIKSKV